MNIYEAPPPAISGISPVITKFDQKYGLFSDLGELRAQKYNLVINTNKKNLQKVN